MRENAPKRQTSLSCLKGVIFPTKEITMKKNDPSFCYVNVSLTAHMHPAITETTIPKFNITTGKETPLFNRAQIHNEAFTQSRKGNVFLGRHGRKENCEI